MKAVLETLVNQIKSQPTFATPIRHHEFESFAEKEIAQELRTDEYDMDISFTVREWHHHVGGNVQEIENFSYIMWDKDARNITLTDEEVEYLFELISKRGY